MPLFVPLFHIAVSLDDLVHGIASIDDGSQLASIGKLAKEVQILRLGILLGTGILSDVDTL